jgi:hypothetical protein
VLILVRNVIFLVGIRMVQDLTSKFWWDDLAKEPPREPPHVVVEAVKEKRPSPIPERCGGPTRG